MSCPWRVIEASHNTAKDLPTNTIRTMIQRHNLSFAVITVVSLWRMAGGVLTVPSSFTGMDENFVRLSLRAAEMSAAVDGQASIQNAITWTYEPDKVMFARYENICWGAFRSTTNSEEDWAQNLDTGIADDVCFEGQCCQTRQGFRDAYLEFEFLEEFEEAIRGCKTECCPNPNNCTDVDEMCDVVLTGTSQGGAIAQVAAVLLRDLNPSTITFGQPYTMVDPCLALDADKLYRFANTISKSGTLMYDPVAFLDYGGADQLGHLFVLVEDSIPVSYYEEGNYPHVSLWDLLATSDIAKVHSLASYINRLEAILKDGIFPVPMNGWGY